MPNPLAVDSKLVGQNVIVSRKNGESIMGLLQSININSISIKVGDTNIIIALEAIESILNG